MMGRVMAKRVNHTVEAAPLGRLFSLPTVFGPPKFHVRERRAVTAGRQTSARRPPSCFEQNIREPVSTFRFVNRSTVLREADLILVEIEDLKVETAPGLVDEPLSELNAATFKLAVQGLHVGNLDERRGQRIFLFR